jgi:membrane protease YdiL (CAAX protease family)
LTWKLVFLPVALAVIFAVNFVASKYYPGGYLFAQAPTDASASLVNLSLLALLMFLGILSSFIFERAKQRSSDQESVWTNFSMVLTDFQFIAAVFVSPIIFNSIYSLVHQNPEGVSDFLLAYQNGFFWQSILAGVTPRRRTAAARK